MSLLLLVSFKLSYPLLGAPMLVSSRGGAAGGGRRSQDESSISLLHLLDKKAPDISCISSISMTHCTSLLLTHAYIPQVEPPSPPSFLCEPPTRSLLSPSHLEKAAAFPLHRPRSCPPLLVASRRPIRMSALREGDRRVERIASAIRVVPDFPKPGIMFQDITTLLLDHKAFKDTIDIFVERYKYKDITVVAGVEARGFIFGPPVALAIGAKFVPLRKPKKLPGEVISEEYVLEYGKDVMEMHVGAVAPGDRVLVVDDLIATGGTLGAAMRLLERVGAEVVECACVIEIPELKGREKLCGKPLYIIVESGDV